MFPTHLFILWLDRCPTIGNIVIKEGRIRGWGLPMSLPSILVPWYLLILSLVEYPWHHTTSICFLWLCLLLDSKHLKDREISFPYSITSFYLILNKYIQMNEWYLACKLKANIPTFMAKVERIAHDCPHLLIQSSPNSNNCKCSIHNAIKHWLRVYYLPDTMLSLGSYVLELSDSKPCKGHAVVSPVYMIQNRLRKVE